jgi:hypothetical protein
VLDPRLNRRARLYLCFFSAALVLGACSSGGGAKDGGAGAGGAGGVGGHGGAGGGVGGHGGAGGGVDAAPVVDTGVDRPADAAGDAGARDAPVDRPVYRTPVAVQVPFASAPANLPAGAHARCLVSGTTTDSSDTCWVVMWGRWTYWPLSYDDNRFSILLAPYDADGVPAPGGAWPMEFKGARYPWLITVDDSAETVTFDGQGTATILVAWDDLRIDQPIAHVDGGAGPVDAAAFPDPIAVLVGLSSAPTPPDGAQVSCVANDHDTAQTSTCWVVKWGSWTYWIFSYIDNRESFMIAPYDSDDVIAPAAGWPKEEMGARYLWAISVDGTARTVTLSGQAARSVTVSWDDLRVDQPDSGRD